MDPNDPFKTGKFARFLIKTISTNAKGTKKGAFVQTRKKQIFRPKTGLFFLKNPFRNVFDWLGAVRKAANMLFRNSSGCFGMKGNTKFYGFHSSGQD
jgi:hypothetical protein